MKSIKSFCLVTICLCATTLLQAQDLKAEIAKPVESTVPLPGSKPAATADLMPQPKMIELRKSENPVQETPSPYSKVKNDNTPAGSLSAENAKILAGKAEKPKHLGPISEVKNADPLPIAKPIILKVPENN